MCAITRSPGMKPCTPSPTCLTTPAISLPGEKGRSGLNWYLFWMRRTSGKFTPLAFTDTKSCPLPGFGEGMSSTTSASGGPHVLHRTAFTRVLLRSCRHHSRLVASATIVGLPCSVPRGGFHDRRHCQARAQVRRILETPGRFDHRYHHPGCDHRADRNRNFRTRLSGTRHAGKNAGGRHLGPADPAACRGDPAMALSQRHARADADVGEDRRCRYVGAGVDAQAGHTGGRAPGDVDSDHSAGGSTLDRLRQAQAGVARQTCRDRGDPGRGRLNPRSLTTGTHARKGEDMSWGFWIVVGIVAAAVVWLISIYNALVARRNRFKNAFAQIDVQLKRRYDLIPNLVETAKGYIKHERGTLEAVIAARNARDSDPEAAARTRARRAPREDQRRDRGRPQDHARRIRAAHAVQEPKPEGGERLTGREVPRRRRGRHRGSHCALAARSRRRRRDGRVRQGNGRPRRSGRSAALALRAEHRSGGERPQRAEPARTAEEAALHQGLRRDGDGR